MTVKRDIKALGELSALRGFSRMEVSGQVIVLLAIAAYIGPAIGLAIWLLQ